MIRTLSIWRWQLVLTGSMAAVVVVIAVFTPETLAVPAVLMGITLLVIMTVVTLATPWARLPRTIVALIPLLDTVAIGFTTSATDLRLGFLWVFPVTWLATYFAMPWVFAGIGLAGASLVVFAPQGDPLPEITLRVLIVVITFIFLGVTVRVGAQRARATRRLLRRQSEQSHRSAERSRMHEERVTQIIDALGSALVVVADDGRILKMNDAYRVLYGRDRYGARSPAAAVEYDARRGVAVPPSRTTIARAARGEELDEERVWLFDGSGRWHALTVSTQPMAGVLDGEQVTMLVFDDVTELLDAAEDRRAVSEIVSHELRNPLTAIIGHVDLLRERTDLPARVQIQLEVIADAGERMQDLVTSALDDTKRKADDQASPVDLRAVVDAAVDSYAGVVAGSGQRLVVTGDPEVRIDGDAFRLRQVLDNLLSNAVKYTAAGGEITVALDGSGDEPATLIVSDTGSGMQQADLERVFEPYFRSADAIRSGTPGSGLGMGIVRDIVAGHGGWVHVESPPGEGLRVIVTLPRTSQEVRRP